MTRDNPTVYHSCSLANEHAQPAAPACYKPPMSQPRHSVVTTYCGYWLRAARRYVVAAACPNASCHLGAGVGIADHWRGIVRKDARHRREVADVTIDDAEQRGDGGLVRGDRIEIAHPYDRTSRL
jgi:hypothetical protein